MRRFVFRSPRLGFLAVGPALARPAAAFYRNVQIVSRRGDGADLGAFGFAEGDGNGAGRRFLFKSAA